MVTFEEKRFYFDFYIIIVLKGHIDRILANFKTVVSSQENLYNEEQKRLFLCYLLLGFLNNTSLHNSLSNFERTVSMETGAAIERCPGK